MVSFLDRLEDYYRAVGQVLRGQASAAAIFPNSSDVGTTREEIYAHVLAQHLPSRCNVVMGGFLFSQSGSESKQMDIIVFNDASLRFAVPVAGGNPTKHFACIDGCVGLVSVKSSLDKSGLVDALCNVASIPDKTPLKDLASSHKLDSDRFDDIPFKIIYATRGPSIQTQLTNIRRFYEERPEIPLHKRPNLIHVAGEYNIVRSVPAWCETRGGQALTIGEFFPFADRSDIFGWFYGLTNMQGIANALSCVHFEYTSMMNRFHFGLKTE